ncbi:hypothetical protein Y032_0590g390 [Ancylostoma ceylanicum]|uniref:Uncharacterized protein n=1 Tax=Ancylostoma ceylanicum TaxID=53326 RepID=A0A016WM68_9BILA|nr:hypothetical protein Y032_0590g390 [Ancylostoma ceylanicum]
MSLRESGRRDAASIVGQVATASPEHATKFKKAKKREEEASSPKMMTSDAALALMLDLGLSANGYKDLRDNAREYGCNIYPPYYQVQESKQRCYPPEESVVVSDFHAEIRLQALFDHTCMRLCCMQEDVFKRFPSHKVRCKLLSKWGCDGSSEQSCYKQKIPEEKSDDCLFCVSLVPLLLVLETAGSTVIWKNPRASSTRYCRPVKLNFTKETSAVIRKEVERVQNEIGDLAETIVELYSGQNAVVKHELLLTMVDGKVCNALSCYDSSQRYYICGAWPKEMNDFRLPVRQENPATLGFGISPLQAWIRSMECILHIAYRIDVKKWAIRSVEDKKKVEERKKNRHSKEDIRVLQRREHSAKIFQRRQHNCKNNRY